MRYYLVAGEASGDLHGASLMKALKERDAEAEFRFYGGNLMQAQGGTLVKHYADMAFMGFAEVVANLGKILRNLKMCKADISTWKPDVVVLIDFPGFNLKIAEYAKSRGFKVCYYISPKVWAWNRKRVLRIKRVIDHLFCILPFEVGFYQLWGMKVDYVGNPLLDAIAAFKPDENFLQKNGLTQKPIIALLPGSRRQEIKRLLPDMIKMIDYFPGHQLVVAGAPAFTRDYYDQFLEGRAIPVVFNATYDLLTHAEAAIVASGTATLETALFYVPQVVVYKGGAISVAIARKIVTIKYISLVNLIMDKQAVQELIQEECNPERIAAELKPLLTGGSLRNTMLSDYIELDKLMGAPGASARVAELMISYLQKPPAKPA